MNEDKLFEEFNTKFKVKEYEVLRTQSWTWSVRPVQPTLGSGVISLNRYALHLSDATPEEMQDLAFLIKKLEAAMKSTFNYSIMNYLMLMMVDHHVHYHVIPRYDAVRSFDGLDWIDNGWPALPVLSDNQHKDQEGILLNIKNALVKNL